VAQPWPGYDDLNVDEVRAALDKASEERTQRVRSYEKDHQDREGVIEKAEQELSRA
jgi:hypothetical protein